MDRQVRSLRIHPNRLEDLIDHGHQLGSVRVAAEHYVERERPACFGTEHLRTGLAAQPPLQDVWAEGVGVQCTREPSTGEEPCPNAGGVVLEEHNQHIMNTELLDGAAAEVADHRG